MSTSRLVCGPCGETITVDGPEYMLIPNGDGVIIAAGTGDTPRTVVHACGERTYNPQPFGKTRAQRRAAQRAMPRAVRKQLATTPSGMPPQ